MRADGCEIRTTGQAGACAVDESRLELVDCRVSEPAGSGLVTRGHSHLVARDCTVTSAGANAADLGDGS